MSTPSDAAGNTAACTLILPVTERLDPHTLQGAVDVLVRTAPPDLDLELLLAIGSIDDATRAAVQALSGDVRTVDGDATDAALATGSVVVAVVDATFRPDISDLAALVARLGRSDDPLPFVHRLGLLVTTAERLRSAGPAHADDGSHLLPELARRLHHDVEAPPQRPSIRQVQETAGTQRVPRPRGLDSRSVCVVVDGNASMVDLDACLTRLKRHTPAGVEMFVVDPGGDYQRSKALRAQRIARVLPGGATHPLARVVRETTREIVVLLEAGTWVTRHWLDGLLDAFADDVVAVGPRTNLGLGHQRQPGVDYREVDEMEAMAARLRRPDDPAAPTHTDVPALSGVCLAVRRDALVTVGGPDEAFTDPELAGVDLCLRLRGFGRFVRADRVFVHVAVLPRGAASGRWRLGATGELALLRARHGLDADRALPGLVTAVMIVKDEEEKIARAIESLSGLVDDVVVCDTGSSDGTVPLLEALGVRTTTFAWCDDFAAARNQALSQASSSWSLLLDADETLDCNDGAGWRLWLAENPTDVVFLVCRNLDSGTGGASVDNASARLLRTEDCHWAGRIHEQMVRRDGTQHLLSGTDLARILHDGYSVARIVERGKVARNANLTQLQLDDVGGMQANEPGRAHFERGRSELLAGNVSEAEQHFLVAIERLPANSELLRRIALCNLGVIANDCGRYEEGARFAEQALDADHVYTQAAVTLAMARLRLDAPGARAEGMRVLRATLRSGNELANPDITRLVLSLRDEGLLIGDAPMLLGGLLLEAGEVDEAVDLLFPLARDHSGAFTAWSVLALALRRQREDWADVLAELAQHVPAALEAVLAQLDADDQAALLAALRRHSVGEWQIGDVDRTWRAMQPQLKRMSRAGVIAAAQQHEGSSPGLALRLWEYAGDDPQCRVGQARCLDALGLAEDAANRLSDVDVAELGEHDLVFVAALAAGLGDFPLAVGLLDALPDDLDADLAAAVARLREALPRGMHPAGTPALR